MLITELLLLYILLKMDILIVEDTLDIGQSIKEYLEACGYHTVWVQTVADCYKQIRTHHFDCVIMDWMLPDGS
ncbi:TPA: hypothetical protein DEP21_02480 [Patescibacteria group bacterium]|nr:hypothetical protein [Candidatus Gracilibacteria bacterium]